MQSHLSQPPMHASNVGRAFATGTRKTPAGFTLVELLVVIGIIALLISILLPSLNKAREQAQTAACLSNQRQIVMGMLQYANDHKGRLPSYGHFITDGYAEDSSMVWWVTLSPYISGSGKFAGIDFMRCPSERDRTRFGTYGLNYGKVPFSPFTYSSAPGLMLGITDYVGSKKVQQVSSGTWLTADCYHMQIGGGGDLCIYSPYLWPLNSDADDDNILDTFDAFIATPGAESPYNHLDPRHGGKAVFSFIDGSCKTVPIAEWAQNKDRMWGNVDW